MRASVLLVLLSTVALAEASPAVSADAPAPAPGGGAPVDPYPGDPSPPAQSPPAPSPPPSQSPPAQSPPAQSPPSQSPPAQSPPAQSPPAQSAPTQSPPAQSPPTNQSPPAHASPANADAHAAGSPAPDAATDAAPPAAQPAPPAPPPLPKNALGLSILPPDAIPAACKSLAKDANAPALNRALSARISLASCVADAKLKPIAMCDCEQSVHDADTATQLSVLLLDEVYVAGDASMKILARQAKGDLLAGLVQRMLATVPPAVNASPEAVQLRQTRLDMLEPLLDPWRAQAQASFTEVDKIARANPQLAKNPAVVAAVQSSRTKLNGPGVARR